MSDNDPFYRQMQLLNNSAETLQVRQTPFLPLQQYGNGMIQDNEPSFSNGPSSYVVPLYQVSNSEPFGTQEGLFHNNNAIINAQLGNTKTILVNNDKSSSNSYILSNEENGDPVKSSRSIPHEIVFPDGRVLSMHGKGPVLLSNAPNAKKRSTPFQASASKIKSKHDIFDHPIFHIEIPSTSDAPNHRASRVSSSGRNRSNVNKRKSLGNVTSTSNGQRKFEYVQPIVQTAEPSLSGIVTPGQGNLPPNGIENAFIKGNIRFKEIGSEEERNLKGQSTNVEPTDVNKSNGLFDIGFSSFMDWLNSNDDDLNDEQTIVNSPQASDDQSALVTTDVQPVAIPPLPTVSSSSTIPGLPDLGVTSEELGSNLHITNVPTGPLSQDCFENIVASRKRKLDVTNDLNDEALESKRPNSNKENALFDDFTDFLDSDVASLKRKIEEIDSNAEFKRMKINSDDMESAFEVDFTDLMDWIDSDNTSFQKMMDSDSSLE